DPRAPAERPAPGPELHVPAGPANRPARGGPTRRPGVLMAGFLLLDDATKLITTKLTDFATELARPKPTPMQQPTQAPTLQPLQDFAQQLIAGGVQQAQQAARPIQDASRAIQGAVASVAPPAQPQSTSAYDPREAEAYIRQAAQQRGIDPETAVKVARSEGLNTYVGDQGSSVGPFELHYGNVAAGGNAVGGLGDTFTKQTGLHASDPSTWRQQVDFALDQAKAGGWGPWHGAAAVGVAPRQGLATTSTGAPVIPSTDRAAGGLPAISQFGDKQLSNAEAYAACGPAAAVRFAQMFGRNPTLREAVDMARGVGWTESSGMAGLQSESRLFTQMGIDHRVVGPDWQALAREAMSG